MVFGESGGSASISSQFETYQQDVEMKHLILGLFPPCPKHGDVRCCSRQGLEALYAGMLKAAISQQPARVQVMNLLLFGCCTRF